MNVRGTYQRARLALDSLPRHRPIFVAMDTTAQTKPRTSALPPGLIAVVNAAPVLHADPAAESVLQPALRECVARAVRRYLSDLHAQMPDDLYELVLHEVETPLLGEVLRWAGGNQSNVR